MSDHRTKRQKTEAMARQTASPKEAAVAREKLKNMPLDPVEYWSFDGGTFFVGNPLDALDMLRNAAVEGFDQPQLIVMFNPQTGETRWERM